MHTNDRVRPTWTALAGIPISLLTLTGCQSYERAPLDMQAHRSSLADRTVETELVSEFATRVARHDKGLPDNLDLNDGMSLPEGEVFALFYNTDLRVARLEAGVTLATAETAGLWEDPEFGFDGAEILSPAAPFEFGLTLSLTIPVSGRLAIEKERAGAEHEAALRRVADAEWTTRAQLRSAWAAWSAASERVSLLHDVLGQIERIQVITDRLEEAGELTRIEARLFRSEQVQTRVALAEAVLSERRARLAVLSLIGLPPHASLALTPEIVTDPRCTVEDQTSRLIVANTTLAVRRAEYRVAEETLRLEVRKQFPDITIGGGYGSEDDDRLLLGFSLPIPILNANRAGIAQARASRDVARAAAETAFEDLEHDLVSTQELHKATRQQRNAFESELVPMLDEQSAEIEQLVALGEVNTLMLLETVRQRYDAKSRLLDLLVAEADAAAQLDRLLGPAQPQTDPAEATTQGAET